MLGRRAALIILAAAVFGAHGCGEDDSLNGVWTGGFKDSLAAFGGGNLTLRQSGATLEGTWELGFQNPVADQKYSNGGTLAGTVEGGAIALRLTSSKGRCSFHLDATRTGRQLAGSYSSVDCATPQKGTLDLEKM